MRAEHVVDARLAEVSQLLARNQLCPASRALRALCPVDMLPSQELRFNELADECAHRLRLILEPPTPAKVLRFQPRSDRR